MNQIAVGEMRLFLGLMVLLALSLPAFADEPAKADTSPHHARVTSEQRFNQANSTHDGHLTFAEAKAGYPLVAKHFDDIDVDHRGYVTADDIRAWQIMRKAARRLAKPPEDKLRPRSAVQHVAPNVSNRRAASPPRNGILGRGGNLRSEADAPSWRRF